MNGMKTLLKKYYAGFKAFFGEQDIKALWGFYITVALYAINASMWTNLKFYYVARCFDCGAFLALIILLKKLHFRGLRRVRGEKWKKVIRAMYFSIYSNGLLMPVTRLHEEKILMVNRIRDNFVFYKGHNFWFSIAGIGNPSFNYALKRLNERPHRIFQCLGFHMPFSSLKSRGRYIDMGYIENFFHPKLVSMNARCLYEGLHYFSTTLDFPIDQKQLQIFMQNLEVIMFCTDVLDKTPQSKKYFEDASVSEEKAYA